MAAGKRSGKKSLSQNDFLEPLTPINVVATDVGTNRAFNDGAASISFSLPAGSPPAASYAITATKVGVGVDSTATGTSGTTSPIVVGGLDSNASYTFTVVATNTAGSSAASSASTPITISTVPSTPPAPTVQNFSNDQNDYVTITAPSFDGGAAITSYDWQSTDGKTGTRSAVGEFTVLQEADTSQQYRVRAVNSDGPSEWSGYSGSNTTPPFFPFFPPSFPFFPFFPPSFPFFPFFPPSFPFFPFFPPSFPFFPFFPPMFPFFPFFPFFPPMFPFFPFFPPMFPFFPFFPPRFKSACLAFNTGILMATGEWKPAGQVQLGDKLTTIDGKYIDMMGLAQSRKSAPLSGTVSFVESEVVSVEVKKSVLIGFNELGKDYSVTQPILVKTDDGITYKEAGVVEVGDVLLGVTTDGSVTETLVESIERDEVESDVYDIRTAPQPWFITKSFIAIA